MLQWCFENFLWEWVELGDFFELPPKAPTTNQSLIPPKFPLWGGGLLDLLAESMGDPKVAALESYHLR